MRDEREKSGRVLGQTEKTDERVRKIELEKKEHQEKTKPKPKEK